MPCINSWSSSPALHKGARARAPVIGVKVGADHGHSVASPDSLDSGQLWTEPTSAQHRDRFRPHVFDFRPLSARSSPTSAELCRAWRKLLDPGPQCSQKSAQDSVDAGSPWPSWVESPKSDRIRTQLGPSRVNSTTTGPISTTCGREWVNSSGDFGTGLKKIGLRLWCICGVNFIRDTQDGGRKVGLILGGLPQTRILTNISTTGQM